MPAEEVEMTNGAAPLKISQRFTRQESFSTFAQSALKKFKSLDEGHQACNLILANSENLSASDTTSSFKECQPKFLDQNSESSDKEFPETSLNKKCPSPTESQLSFGEEQDVVMTMKHQMKFPSQPQRLVQGLRDIRLQTDNSALDKTSLPTASTLCSSQNLDPLPITIRKHCNRAHHSIPRRPTVNNSTNYSFITRSLPRSKVIHHPTAVSLNSSTINLSFNSHGQSDRSQSDFCYKWDYYNLRTNKP